MAPSVRYAVISTEWGYFALAAVENSLAGTILPRPTAAEAATLLQRRFPSATADNNLFKALQEQIKAYFAGISLRFDPDIPLHTESMTAFSCEILIACRKIAPGRTETYGRLAARAGRPTAARAAGRVMASNPMPLIVPCHRVVAADGRLGGFSAAGGTTLKKRLLEHEQLYAE